MFGSFYSHLKDNLFIEKGVILLKITCSNYKKEMYILKKEKNIALTLLCVIALSNLSALTVFAQDAQSVLTQATTVTDQTSDKAEEASTTEATKAPESVSTEATTVASEASHPSANDPTIPKERVSKLIEEWKQKESKNIPNEKTAIQ